MVSHLITHLINRFILGFMTRNVHSEAKKVDQDLELHYSLGLKVASVFLLGGMSAAAALVVKLVAAQSKTNSSAWIPMAVVGSGGFAAALLLVHVLTYRLRFNALGFSAPNWFFPRRELSWSSVRSYSFNKFLSLHRFSLDHGGAVQLPMLLSGLPDWLAALKRQNSMLAAFADQALQAQIQALKSLQP